MNYLRLELLIQLEYGLNNFHSDKFKTMFKIERNKLFLMTLINIAYVLQNGNKHCFKT